MHVRGTALRGVLVALDAELGAGTADRVRAELPPHVRERLEPTILSGEWYPVACQAALHEAVRAVVGKGALTANERVGYRAGLDDFRGVYRVFLPLLTWDLLWSSVERAWLRYNSAGSITFVTRSAMLAKAEVRDVSGFTEAMWHAVAGRLRATIEIAGGRDVRVGVEAWAESGATLIARWTKA